MELLFEIFSALVEKINQCANWKKKLISIIITSWALSYLCFFTKWSDISDDFIFSKSICFQNNFDLSFKRVKRSSRPKRLIKNIYTDLFCIKGKSSTQKVDFPEKWQWIEIICKFWGIKNTHAKFYKTLITYFWVPDFIKFFFIGKTEISYQTIWDSSKIS